MKKTVILFAIALLVISCEKKPDSPSLAGGTYYGIKKVYYSSTEFTSSDTITLVFGADTYSYSGSNALDYGKGKYIISDDVIQFNDEYARNTLYTWDWILSGQFKHKSSGDSLILTRSYYGQDIMCRLRKVEAKR
jgi:hypothetical protein